MRTAYVLRSELTPGDVVATDARRQTTLTVRVSRVIVQEGTGHVVIVGARVLPDGTDGARIVSCPALDRPERVWR